MRGDFSIGDWLIHPAVNSMERDGETVHLEPKVMQVLVALSSEPGEVVTREHLRSVVWPDVFVGEDVLIRAISELRRAFSDAPRLPSTIETIPKVGYRLIAPISQLPTGPANPVAQPARSPEPVKPEAQEVASDPQAMKPAPPVSVEGASRTRLLLWSLLSLLALAVAIWAVIAFRPTHRQPRTEAYTSRPLTTYPGSELQPSFSPDGSAVAFVWHKDGELHGHIFVKQLGSEAPARLTSGAAEELSPAWSPDGRWIALIRHDETRTSILIIPAIGGSEQEVYTLPSNHVWEYGGLNWTADGKSLIFPQQAGPQALFRLETSPESSLHPNPVAGW